MGVSEGVSHFAGKKRYKGVRFNVIGVTKGWVGISFPEKALLNTFNGPKAIHSSWSSVVSRTGYSRRVRVYTWLE